MARCSELPTQLERDTMNNSHTLYSPSTKSKVWVLFVDAPFIYTKMDGQQAKKKKEKNNDVYGDGLDWLAS